MLFTKPYISFALAELGLTRMKGLDSKVDTRIGKLFGHVSGRLLSQYVKCTTSIANH